MKQTTVLKGSNLALPFSACASSHGCNSYSSRISTTLVYHCRIIGNTELGGTHQSSRPTPSPVHNTPRVTPCV